MEIKLRALNNDYILGFSFILRDGRTKLLSCPAGLKLVICLPHPLRLQITGMHHHVWFSGVL